MPVGRIVARIFIVACAALALGSTARAQSVDPDFDPGMDRGAGTILLQPDGKIILVGGFLQVGGGTGTYWQAYLARLHADGSFDTTWTPQISQPLNCAVRQPDGKLIIGSADVLINGVWRRGIARLNADGSLDASFDPRAFNSVFEVALQPDGKILVGGAFVYIAESNRSRIARLNPDGSIDSTFDPGANNSVSEIAVQPDGKILIAGQFTAVGGGTGTIPRQHIARLNADGSVDMSFNPGTNLWGMPFRMAVQPDGKILVAGYFTSIGGGTGTTARNHIARLNADGLVDSTFDPGANGDVTALALMADGRILVGGAYTRIGDGSGTMPRNYLARLNANGSVDTSFDPGANNSVGEIVPQPDGRVLVAGGFTTLGGGGTGSPPRNRIGRLLVDPPSPPATRIHPSNQTVVVGLPVSFLSEANGNPGPTVQWIASTGGGGEWSDVPGATSPVVTFTTTATDNGRQFRAVFTNALGVAISGAATLTVIAPASPVISTHPVNQSVTADVTASFSAAASGNPPPTVRWQVSSTNGSTWTDVTGATATTYAFIAVEADNGKWFRAVFTNLGGYAASNPAVLVVNPTVAPIDPTFNPGANGLVFDLKVQPDGKILVGGTFDTLGGGGTGTTTRHGLGRLNGDGSLDAAFNPSAGDGMVQDFAVQPDGKIVVAGNFYELGGASRQNLGRLNADGTVDAAFNTTAESVVNALILQQDGKILVGGEFRSLGDSSGSNGQRYIGRLNADGSVDRSFALNLSNGVRVFAMQADGKVLVGGSFHYIEGAAPYLARLNADGSLDTSFKPGMNDRVRALAVQPDGRILVGGVFTMIGGGGTGTIPRNRIARLNPDGSVDTTFNPGADGMVDALMVQADGTILVGGWFTALGAGSGTTPRKYIGRLTADGSVDAGFDPGANDPVLVFALQQEGHVLLGGYFTALGGGTGTTWRHHIGRLLFEGPPTPPTVTTHPSNQAVTVGGTAWLWAAAIGNPPPTVRWQVSANEGNTWDDIMGATSTTYAFTTTLVDDGKWFRAVFTNSLGNVASHAASLVVQPLMPPVVTIDPSNQTVRAGRLASFSAAASGLSPSVRWQTSANHGSTWSDVGGATSTTYAFTATAAAHGTWFRAVFTNNEGSATTAAATLTVRSVSGSDFDGNATTDIAVYRRTTGFWYVGDDQWVQYGGPGYVPVPGDYNGDGTTDIAVYEPASGEWYVRGQFWTQFGHPGDIPVPGDYDGDGTTDLAVYRPSTGGWYVRDQLGIIGFGGPDYIPVVADYNGDGSTDIAVYRPFTGFWYVRNQLALQFGVPGDVPVAADYNGDARADLAVYQPSTGMWRVRNQFTVTYGAPADLPVARDFDGNGTADIAVYRPSTGHWFVRNQFTLQFGDAMDVPVPGEPLPLTAINGDYDGDRVTNLAVFNTTTALWRVRNGLTVTFGEPSDKPVPADYDGNGSIDIAVWRPSTGTWYVRDQFTVQFGDASDTPVPGDYNGDGLAEVAVYRPSTGFWYFHNQPAVHFGDSGDVPVPGDYNGDGATEIAVYRPSTGDWYVRNQMAVQFGAPGLTPVPGDYNGDGLTDVAVFDTATAAWYIRGYPAIVFGDPTDTPVPGDYDGDGTTDIAVYRPSTGEWIVRNQFTLVFGDPGDVPVVRNGANR